MISVRFTYDVCGEESDASGGFCDCFGQKLTDWSMSTLEIRQTGVEQYTIKRGLAYFIERAIALGIYEPSAPEPYMSGTVWFSSVDADINYSTGKETFYNLHLTGLNAEEMRAIAGILSRKEITDEEESWLASLDQAYSVELSST